MGKAAAGTAAMTGTETGTIEPVGGVVVKAEAEVDDDDCAGGVAIGEWYEGMEFVDACE